MKSRWLCVTLVGCGGVISAPPMLLRVEPASIDVTVELALPPPSASVSVFVVNDDGGEDDVTADATFALTGAALGTLDGATWTSDGLNGGAAMLQVGYGRLATAIPLSATVHELRIVDGTPPGAPDAFATATRTQVDANLDPSDGAVLPPDLGRLVISFAAADADDAQQVLVTGPYLDLEIDSPGVAGPRALELLPAEWSSIARTERGGGFELDVATLSSAAPATASVATAELEIADLDASSLLAGAIVGTELPSMWRYDMRAGSAAPMFANPAGACIGCHLAVSADGTRIGAVLSSPTTLLAGVILDVQNGSVLAQADPTSASPWVTAAFDPSGALVGGWQGALSLRDGTTGASIAPIAIAEAAASPAISPDGTQLAYVTLDEGFGADATQPVGNALHVRPWNASIAQVGAPIELVRDPDGNGVVLPVFSSDSRWIAYGISENTPARLTEAPIGSAAVRADGSGTVIALTSNPLDRLAHWASPIALARSGDRAPEPMVWIAFTSERALGGNATSLQQLWLEAFYPDRGVIAPAFHLPGQPATLQVLHGPISLPGS